MHVDKAIRGLKLVHQPLAKHFPSAKEQAFHVKGLKPGPPGALHSSEVKQPLHLSQRVLVAVLL